MSEFEFWGELGNIFKAIVAYQHKTIEFNKRFVNPWLKLGTVFDQTDNNADALLASRKAIEIDKENGENWLSLGDVYFKMGAFDDAANAYIKAIELNPNLGWAYANLALANVTRQKYNEAVNLYVKSLEYIDDDQDRAMIWNRLGNVYRKVNDYENAFIAFQMADECDDHNTGFDDQLDEVTVEQKVMPIVAEVFVGEKNASVDDDPIVVENEPVHQSEIVAVNDESVGVADAERSDQESVAEIEPVDPMSEGDSPLDVDETADNALLEEAVVSDEMVEAVESNSVADQQDVTTVANVVDEDFEMPDDDQVLKDTLSADEAEPVVENVEVNSLIKEGQQPASITEKKVVEEWLSDDAEKSPDEAFANQNKLGEIIVDSTNDLQTEVTDDVSAEQVDLAIAQLDDVSNLSMEDESSQPELAEDSIEENIVEPDASLDDSPVSEILITEEIESKDNDGVQLQATPEVQSAAVDSEDVVTETVSDFPVDVNLEIETEEGSKEEISELPDVKVSVDASIEVTDEEAQPALISDPDNDFFIEDVVDEIKTDEAPIDDLDDKNAIGDLPEAEKVVVLNASEEIESDVVSIETVEGVESDEPLQENSEEVKSDTVSDDDVHSVESEVDVPSLLDATGESLTDAVESSEPDAENPSLDADMTPLLSHDVETFADPSGENQPVVLAIEDLAKLLQQTVAEENVEDENKVDDTELKWSSENEASEDVTDPVMDEDAQTDVEAEKDDVAEVVAEITVLANMNNEDVSVVDETDQLPVSEVTESDEEDNSAYEEFLKHAVEPVMENDDANISKSGYSVMNDLNAEPDTKNAHVWNELGNVYFNTGAYDEAVAAYSKAIELDDWFAWPYSNLALVYVQKEKYTEAIMLYQRGIELFSSDTDKAITWNRLGNVYRRLSDYDNAISCYQRADELDPNNATRSLRSRFSLLGNLNIEQSPSVAA